jgi:hypothetical protein
MCAAAAMTAGERVQFTAWAAVRGYPPLRYLHYKSRFDEPED